MTRNYVTVYCSNCQRLFKYHTTEEGDFAGWKPCECGQEIPETEHWTRLL